MKGGHRVVVLEVTEHDSEPAVWVWDRAIGGLPMLVTVRMAMDVGYVGMRRKDE